MVALISFMMVAIIVLVAGGMFAKDLLWSIHSKLDKRIVVANNFLSEMGKCTTESIRERYDFAGANSFVFELPYQLRTIRKKRTYLKQIDSVIEKFRHDTDCIDTGMSVNDVVVRDLSCLRSLGYQCSACKWCKH